MFSGGHDPTRSLLPDVSPQSAPILPVQGGGGDFQSSKGWQSIPITIEPTTEYKPKVNHAALKKFQTKWKQTLGPNIPSRRKPRQDPHIIVGTLNTTECPTYIVAPLRGDENAASDVFAWASNLLETKPTSHIVFIGPLSDNAHHSLIENGISSLLSLYPGHIIYVSEKETGLPSLSGLLLRAIPNTSKQVAIGFIPDDENVYNRSSRNLDCLKVETLKVPFSRESEEDSSRSIFKLTFDIPKAIRGREKDSDIRHISDDIAFKAIPGWVAQIVHGETVMEGGAMTTEQYEAAAARAAVTPKAMSKDYYPQSPTPYRDGPRFTSVAGEAAAAPAGEAATASAAPAPDAPRRIIGRRPASPASVPASEEGQGESEEEGQGEEEGEEEEEPEEENKGATEASEASEASKKPALTSKPSSSHQPNEERNYQDNNNSSSAKNKGNVTVNSLKFKVRDPDVARKHWLAGRFTKSERSLLEKQDLLYPNDIYAEILKILANHECDNESDAQLKDRCRSIINYLQVARSHRMFTPRERMKVRRDDDNANDNASIAENEYVQGEEEEGQGEEGQAEEGQEGQEGQEEEEEQGRQPGQAKEGEEGQAEEGRVRQERKVGQQGQQEQVEEEREEKQGQEGQEGHAEEGQDKTATTSEPSKSRVKWANENGNSSLVKDPTPRRIVGRMRKPKTGGSRKRSSRISKNNTVKLRFIY